MTEEKCRCQQIFHSSALVASAPIPCSLMCPRHRHGTGSVLAVCESVCGVCVRGVCVCVCVCLSV